MSAWRGRSPGAKDRDAGRSASGSVPDSGNRPARLPVLLLFGTSFAVSLVLYAFGASIVVSVALGSVAGFVAANRLTRPRPPR